MNQKKDKSFDLEEELENALMESIEKEKSNKKNKTPDPEEIYIFPLRRRPFFPGMAAPLVVEPGPFYEVLKIASKSEDKCIGLLLTKSEEIEVNKTTFKDLHNIGTMARILKIIPLDGGGAQVILNMEKRIQIVKPIVESEHLKASVTYHVDDPHLSLELKAYAISIISTIKELLKLNPLFKEELQIFLSHSDFTDPGKLADFAAALTTATRDELQEILSAVEIQKRIDLALVLLKKELDISFLQNTINQKIDATISKTQKEYFLKEQLKAIKKELGIEKDDKSIDREKFEERLKQRVVPADVMKVINEEMEKLSHLETHSPEYSVCRNYLDWLTNIPWGIYDKESHQLSKAKRVLEADHYGLKEINERILEFISVGKLCGNVKGSIICLLGPPGVGKTSIGKSIAKALNRKFYRFSVGGMRDEAEIKGHRRTYIGAMPGKLMQALKHCQVMNPVIMLDEIDKIGNSYHGDPASALLEVLDPEQNSDFLDHYLDVRCSLSDVLFIVTANVLDSIPEALKDRMEILRLSGYIANEKVEIAQKFLIPRNLEAMGLQSSEVVFNKESIRAIINGYAREAGVRNLENLIKKVLRKVAVKIVQDNEVLEKAAPPVKKKKGKTTDVAVKRIPTSDPYLIKVNNLKDYLGKPVFTSDRFYDKTPIGVCMGLAWTSMGGATLYIEATKVATTDKILMKLTGQAGSVMKESSEIAWTYLHSAVEKYTKDKAFFKKSQVHIHIPEGATPKDGPSAGITMVTALLSLLLNKPVLQNLGMTGELTLTGRVLPIGGVKEKLVAARRSGLTQLIFPKDNMRDYDELPEYIKEGITIHFVSHYDEVYKIAFPKSL